ncbi:MAG: sulfatase-like hydrolase/transferase [Parafilimonas sp.]
MIYCTYIKAKKLPGIFAFLLLQCCFINVNSIAQLKPNIIFILADDVGYSVPTINGGQSYSTPRIDSMARHGMNFTHCEATPLCATSRISFLTGKYNFRNYSNWGYMSDTAKTIANVMHDAGYATGIFGKLQLQYGVDTMKKWGWDYHIIFELTEDTMAYRRYKNPVLMENGYRIPDSVTANKYCDDILTQRIFSFIKNNRSKPFFVYYSMSIGHAPYSPTPDDSTFAAWNPKNNPSDTSYFPSMMKYMDKKVGLILDMLHKSGLDKNTIVFFVGDNGTPPEIYYNADGIHYIKGEKGSSKEGGTHVPCVAYWPGQIAAGSVNDDLIQFPDFLPTFAQAGKVSDLTKYGVQDGRSFYNVLFGQAYAESQQLFCHFDPHPDFTDLQRWVRDKTYKLYDSTITPKAGKFYNIVNDEPEMHPIAIRSLTQVEKEIKQNFQNILDTIGTWPDAPTIKNAASANITNTSAIVSATVVSAGASFLIDMGSCLANPNIEAPYLQYARLHVSIVALGQFSQKRTGLTPQTEYRYSLYAMNNNVSHSTSFVEDTFYTLSNPPLLQPTSFAATSSSVSVNLSWSNAKYPNYGAKVAGYLLVYSAGKVKLINDPNGKPPESVVTNGIIVPVTPAILPKLPATTVTVSGLKQGTTYHFTLIPYTWDGLKTATYNYLTANALTTNATTKENIMAMH